MAGRSRYAARPRAAAPAGSIAGEPPRVHRHVGIPIESIAAGLMCLGLAMLGTMSPELLNAWHVHYISAGGAFFEKLHPATYLMSLALLLLLLRGGVVGEIDRMISNSKLLLVYLFACVLLVIQCLALDRPFTGVIDTFLLPLIVVLVVWNLAPRRRKPLIFAIHLFIWINIGIGFYEYFSGHRLVPITLGDVVVTDWRSTALLGHPLTAAGIVAMYIMTLVLRPQRSFWAVPAVLVAVSSLMAFGGRTALISVIVVFAGCALVQCGRLICGERVRLPSVIAAICLTMLAGAVISIVLSAGTFDSMIDRFSSDNGSAHARIATLHFLSQFDWKEILLGTEANRSTSLQTMMGLAYGIENFWIASIVQYGLIQTALITIGLVCFFAEVLRRSASGAWVTVLFICIVAASSVSFSSKNITLAVYVALIVLLLPRERAAQPAQTGSANRRQIAYGLAVPAR
jgi:hypothetical protein